MKKILFVLAACMTLALGFTSCKLETAKITIAVTDLQNNPIADRPIYWTTEAAVYASLITPAPDAPLRDTEVEDLSYMETNAQGIVTTEIVAGLQYCYLVKDLGSNQWQSQVVKLQGGEEKEITFKVNK